MQDTESKTKCKNCNCIPKILWIIIIGNLVITLALTLHITSPSDKTLKTLHYETETAVLVSPHALREDMEHGENPYVIIDTREPEHYKLGHITGAINIPPDNDMVTEFKEIIKKYPDKEVLIYCYTSVCMRGRKVGKELASNGVYVRELGVGFQEWKNDWKSWNYEWEKINIQPLITEGEEPGIFIPTKHKKEGCAVNEDFSC